MTPPTFETLRLDLNRLVLPCTIPIVKGHIIVGTHGRGDLYLTIDGPSLVIEHPPTVPDLPGLKAGVTDTIGDGKHKTSRYNATIPTASAKAWDFMVDVIRQAGGWEK